MTIIAIGINHKTASVRLREKVYFGLDKLSLYLQDLLHRGIAREAVLLSTCNRSELYCEGDDIPAICDWFCSQTSQCEELQAALYIHQDQAAVAHMMQVACGLDSMVLGEPQILGQMKEAFSESCAASAIGPLFHRLFQTIFFVAKEIRTTTDIGACPVSVASAAIHFAKQCVSDLSQAHVALIGAGDTTQLLIQYLKPCLKHPLLLINRNLDKAQSLVPIGARFYGLNEITEALFHADLVFSATGSPKPLVTQPMVQEVLNRKASDITFIDIAVPRDIDPVVSELTRARLYCIDDLKTIIENNRQGREHAALKAEELIRKKSAAFMAELGSLNHVTDTIRAYRGQIEELCRNELLKAKFQLQQGADPETVLDAFAHAFIQKLLHVPSVQLRQAGVEGRFELLRYAKQLFAIPDTEQAL